MWKFPSDAPGHISHDPLLGHVIQINDVSPVLPLLPIISGDCSFRGNPGRTHVASHALDFKARAPAGPANLPATQFAVVRIVSEVHLVSAAAPAQAARLQLRERRCNIYHLPLQRVLIMKEILEEELKLLDWRIRLGSTNVILDLQSQIFVSFDTGLVCCFVGEVSSPCLHAISDALVQKPLPL